MQASVLCASLFATMAGASIHSLQDEARPMLSSEKSLLRWWEGGPAFALASLGAVRVNFRGLYAYPPQSAVRSLETMGWHKVTCNVSAWALCASDAGQAFPAVGPRLPETIEAVMTAGWDTLDCADNRHKILVSLGFYDISACDILDEGLDVVYSGGELFHRHSTIDVWEYWVFVVMSIVLVRFFSYNIQVLWGSQQGVKPQWQALACCLVVIIVVIADGDSHFVTSADQVFFWCNVIYIAVYLVLHVWAQRHALMPALDTASPTKPDADITPVYNIIVATLQLVACRFYASAETPYNLVLIGILATRAWFVSNIFKIILYEVLSLYPVHSPIYALLDP